jgi:hypothetical protein
MTQAATRSAWAQYAAVLLSAESMAFFVPRLQYAAAFHEAQVSDAMEAILQAQTPTSVTGQPLKKQKHTAVSDSAADVTSVVAAQRGEAHRGRAHKETPEEQEVRWQKLAQIGLGPYAERTPGQPPAAAAGSGVALCGAVVTGQEEAMPRTYGMGCNGSSDSAHDCNDISGGGGSSAVGVCKDGALVTQAVVVALSCPADGIVRSRAFTL